MSLCSRPSTIRPSLHFKLFSLFTLLTAAATILFGTVLVLKDIRENRRHATEKLQLLAVGFADSIRLPLFAENRDLLTRYAQELLRYPQIKGVEIFTANGTLLLRLPERLPVDPVDLITKKVEVRSSPFLNLPERSMAGEHGAQGNLFGFVRLYRETADLSHDARAEVATTCIVAILFWLLISCSCYQLLRRVTRSFQALMQGLKLVHGGDYASRIQVLSDDEPGRASAAVNQLACALGDRERENRRLNQELTAAVAIEIASKEQMRASNLSLEVEGAERRRAELELKNLVEQLPVGIIWSGEDGSIEYLNRFMVERIGYTQDEVPTFEEWMQVAVQDDAQRERAGRCRKTSIKTWKSGENATMFYDLKVVCKDGSVRDMNCSNQIAGARTVDIMIDMTERELLQQQLIRNQKLESLGVLAGGIAHNFNNALTGVLGFISFARNFLDKSDRPFELLLQAEAATRRAAGLANQLLSFARGGAPIRKAASLVKIVNEALSLATSGSRVLGVVKLPASLHYGFIDEGQLCQAFNCICINAVQSMTDGGELVVRGRNVSTRDEKLPVPLDGEYVELTFQDQGCGIAEKDKPYIFTPYFTTRAEVGHGLGLATVYSIVTRHGGSIGFISTVGKGTTFTLYLPAVREAVSEPFPAEGSAAPKPCLSGCTILVMDDEEIVRVLACAVLEKQGCLVTLCADGEEAVSRYRESHLAGTPYLAAILDLTIPGGMGGIETAREILAIDPGARLIVSSGYSNDVVMNSYREHGFCAAHPKPYDAQELTALLNRIRAGIA